MSKKKVKQPNIQNIPVPGVNKPRPKLFVMTQKFVTADYAEIEKKILRRYEGQ